MVFLVMHRHYTLTIQGILCNYVNSLKWDGSDKFYTVIHTLFISNEETFLHDFLAILKHSLQNYLKILKKYFLGTSCI